MLIHTSLLSGYLRPEELDTKWLDHWCEAESVCATNLTNAFSFMWGGGVLDRQIRHGRVCLYSRRERVQRPHSGYRLTVLPTVTAVEAIRVDIIDRSDGSAVPQASLVLHSPRVPGVHVVLVHGVTPVEVLVLQAFNL